MMKPTTKSVLTAALIVMMPIGSLVMTARAANAQQRSVITSGGTLVERPAQTSPVRRPRPTANPTAPLEVIITEPVTLEPADNSGGGLPADDPWITHCLTDHDAGEDIDDCLKDGGF